MTGPKGSSAKVRERQLKVFRYYIRGLGPEEIARVKDIGASRATIYRDVEQLEARIAEHIDAQMLWPIGLAVAIKKELIREGWRVYHRDPEQKTIGKGDDAVTVQVDPSFRQLMALGSVTRVTRDMDRLAGYGLGTAVTVVQGRTAEFMFQGVRIQNAADVDQVITQAGEAYAAAVNGESSASG